MGIALAILGLIVGGLITYIDWSNPDKKATHAPFGGNDSPTVDGNNERKRQQISALNRRVKFLNRKYPTKEFYRDGAFVKERNGSPVPKLPKGYYKKTGNLDLSKHEIPHLISSMLVGSGTHELAWSNDGKYIIFKFDVIAKEDEDYAELAKAYLSYRDFERSSCSNEEFDQWTKELTITQLEVDEDTMRPQVSIEPSIELLDDESYLRMEVESHGRLFTRNYGNNHRWLIGAPNKTDNTILKATDGWSVHLATSCYRPKTTFLSDNYAHMKMKKNQVIEGLESRLWNRKRVLSFHDNGDVAILKVS